MIKRSFKHHRWTEQEILFLKENYGILYVDEISKILNINKSKIITKARNLKLKSNLPKRYDKNNYILKIIQSGNLPMEELKNISKKINFKCYNCGNIFKTTPFRIASGHTKSCGCVSLGKRKGSKYFSKTFYQHLKNAAVVRDIEFNLSILDLDNLLEKQNFKCAMSGIDLTYGYGEITKLNISVDRLDYKLGYTINNIQLVDKKINMARQRSSPEDFIKMCIKVAEYNAHKFSSGN